MPPLLPVRDKRQGDGDVFVAGSLVGACKAIFSGPSPLLSLSLCSSSEENKYVVMSELYKEWR